MQSQGKIPALQGLVLVKSLLKVPAPGELLPNSWAYSLNLLQSRSDKIKKKLRNLVTFFCSSRNLSIRSMATDKLDMTAIYYKWTFILLNRNLLFIIISICCLSAILKSGDTSNHGKYPVKTPTLYLGKTW